MNGNNQGENKKTEKQREQVLIQFGNEDEDKMENGVDVSSTDEEKENNLYKIKVLTKYLNIYSAINYFYFKFSDGRNFLGTFFQRQKYNVKLSDCNCYF